MQRTNNKRVLEDRLVREEQAHLETKKELEETKEKLKVSNEMVSQLEEELEDTKSGLDYSHIESDES